MSSDHAYLVSSSEEFTSVYHEPLKGRNDSISDQIEGGGTYHKIGKNSAFIYIDKYIKGSKN